MNIVRQAMLMALFVLLPVYVSGDLNVGTTTATPTDSGIWVSAAYSGDTDSNSTLKVFWKLSTTPDWPSEAQYTLPNMPSPFIQKIAGLANGTSYDLRVEFVDPPVSGPNPMVFRGIVPSRSIHNSDNATAGSMKWQAEGGWGIPGGKYGQFDCSTCHQKNAPNIKRIKGVLTSPSGDPLPGGVISFQNVTGFGDDSDNHQTSSRVCEACHSQTAYHRYDSSGLAVKTHFNASDCIPCHVHNNGFKARCDACHNAPPAAGKHATHFGTGTAAYGNPSVQSTTAAYVFSCGICHNGVHLNTPGNPHTVEVTFAGIATQDPVSGSASYVPSSSSVDDPGHGWTFNYSDGTCSNVYCHGNYPGSGKNASPKFGTGTAVCGSCHNASNTATPASGKHGKHTDSYYYEFKCTTCHKDIVGGTSPAGYTITDKSKHVNGYVDYKFDPADPRVSGGVYSIATGTAVPANGAIPRTFGSCNNIYCHSNVQPNGGVGGPSSYSNPSWGTAGSAACGSCHAGGHGALLGTGSHTAHLAYAFTTSDIYKCVICHSWDQSQSMNCSSCHNFYVTPEYARHANYKIEVSFDRAFNDSASYGKSPSFTPGTGYSNCTNTYCHSSGTSVSTGEIPDNTTPNWGSESLQCNSCHGNPPGYANGSPKANSHGMHVVHSAGDCSNCHYATTADGTTITDKTKHLNKAYDLVPKPGNSFTYTYAADGGTCATNACHGDAKWGSLETPAGSGCQNCHGHEDDWPVVPGYTWRGTKKSHATHTENDANDLKGPNLQCSDCHETNNFPRFKDGGATLSATTACNPCHSPGGSYDGVNDPVVGAKANWKTGIYNSDKTTLQSGKEKWCVTCHDESASVISGVTAPNVAGNESGAYDFGTGWGYYKTGHGLPSSQTYPASGGVTAGAAVECSGCHDTTAIHIDGLARTFDDQESETLDPSYYRLGYRLRMVAAGQGSGATGLEPMLVPAPAATANSANNYGLCVNCHDSGPFVDSGNMNTNLKTDGVNRHEYHLKNTGVGKRVSSDWSNTAACSSDWTQCNSRMTCTTCHNVHGSTRLAMINDGMLVAREPGLDYWYYNPAIVSFSSPPDAQPTPATLPLSASTGTVWSGGSSSNLCSHCHGNNWLTTESRTPFQNVAVAPTLSWADTAGYEFDGVNPDTAGGGSSFTFRVKYTDGNDDAPSVYQVWIDTNDNGSYEPGEKLDMTALDGADLNYFDGKIYTLSMPLYKQGDNTLNHRFYFRDASSDATGAPASDRQVTVTNSLPTLSWTGEINYITDGVDPNTGGNGSTFTFRVKYTDLDNEAPDADGVRVLISGTYYTLDPESGGSYGTGKIYSKGIALTTSGALNYRFVAKDPAGVSATGDPASDHVVTVLESSNNPPILSFASANCLTEGVRPRTGAIDADYEFRVIYSDADNQCPTYVRVTLPGPTTYDLTDNDGGSCQSGRTYYRTIVLAASGDLNYSFSASDGTDTATGTPTSNHVVSVINTSYKLRPTGGSGWYSDLATAYNATPASGTLLVYPNADFTAATYTGGLSNINKMNRTLQSVCGADFTIISGGGTVINLQGNDGAVIDGFSITGGATYGIYSNSDSLTLKNSKVYSNATGIHLNNGCNPVSVQNTEIYSNTSYGINSPSSLNVLSITSCNLHDNSGGTGGAININNGTGHTIANTSFTANSGSTNGGAIYCNACSITIDDSIFRSNTAGAGGAIYLLNAATATITDTFIQGNSVTGSGGGINVANATATANLTNVIMTGNRASSNGGAVFLQGTINTLFTTVSGNYAGNLGGAVYNNSTAASAVRNSIIYNNDAANGVNTKQIYSVSAREQYLTAYSTLINQSAGVSGSNSYTDGGNNNTSGNPDFVMPIAAPSSATPTTSGDFHLKSGSPAINAASSSWTADHDIFDSTPGSRPKGGFYDMGAHEKE